MKGMYAYRQSNLFCSLAFWESWNQKIIFVFLHLLKEFHRFWLLQNGKIWSNFVHSMKLMSRKSCSCRGLKREIPLKSACHVAPPPPIWSDLVTLKKKNQVIDLHNWRPALFPEVMIPDPAGSISDWRDLLAGNLSGICSSIFWIFVIAAEQWLLDF